MALRNPRTRTLHAVLLTLTTFTTGCIFVEAVVDAAVRYLLPQICIIFLAALWVAFSMLFSVSVLYHVSEDSQISGKGKDIGGEVYGL
jgi:hypothetical protein